MGPLEWIEQHSPNHGRARQIFLLTDGEISNVTQVLDLCRSMASSTRIFSFGLGKSPSRSLVKGLARSTNGRFVFVPPNSSVDTYVGEQLQKALQPYITNVNVKWNLGVDVETAPKQSPPVYLNDRLIVYALTNDNTIPFDHNSSVELQIEPDHHSIGVAKINQIPNVAENKTIARLAAKALILELQHAKLPSSIAKTVGRGSTQARFQGMVASNEEKMEVPSDEETSKQRIIELSLKYNILSPHTAFVGIEKRTDASNADMTLREVPIEISADDQQLFRSVPGFAFGAGAWPGARVGAFGAAVGNAGFGFVGGAAAGAFAGAGFGFSGSSGDSRASQPLSFFKCASKSIAMPLDRMECNDTRAKARKKKIRMRENVMNYDNGIWGEDTISSQSDDDKPERIPQKNNTWPSTNQDIVRYLINKQNFDGLWNPDNDIIKNLTGKSLSAFQSTNPNMNDQILTSLIIIIILETRFGEFSTLWYGVAQKARKRITDLIEKDTNKFDTLVEDIRKQL